MQRHTKEPPTRTIALMVIITIHDYHITQNLLLMCACVSDYTKNLHSGNS